MEQRLILTQHEYKMFESILSKSTFDEEDAVFIMKLLRRMGIITNTRKFVAFKPGPNILGFSKLIVAITPLAVVEILASGFKDFLLLEVEVSRGRRSWSMNVVVQSEESAVKVMRK